MTDEDRNADDVRSTGQETRGPAETDGAVDWTDVPADPEPDDLGYQRSQWERIPVDTDDQVVFLPGNEEDIADDAFVVLDVADLCDLVNRR